jgi:membrane protein
VLATVVGSITFLLGATGAFLELQYALNTIWRVAPKATAGLRDFLVQRLVSFGLVVAIGFLLMVSLAVSAALAAFSGWLNARVPGMAFMWMAVNLVISIGVTTILFALVYKVLPDVDLDWPDVWIGALMTSVLFAIGKTVIGLYIGHSSTASSYGAAGSVVVLLLWVYYSAQVVLFGAELTRAYTATRRGAPKPVEYAKREKRAGK